MFDLKENLKRLRLLVHTECQCIIAIKEGFKVELVRLAIVVAEAYFRLPQRPATLCAAISGDSIKHIDLR